MGGRFASYDVVFIHLHVIGYHVAIVWLSLSISSAMTVNSTVGLAATGGWLLKGGMWATSLVCQGGVSDRC